MTKIIHIKDIGEIHLKKNTRARNLKISIKPFTGVIVTVPQQMPYKTAEEIVLEKIKWIKKSLIKIEEAENRFTVFDLNTKFSTNEHDLEIYSIDEEKIKIIVSDGKIKIHYSKLLNIRDEQVQQSIRKGIEEAWRIEAKKHLPGRVVQLAQKHGFKFNILFIKNIKSRWGSCSQVNNINLSLHLIRLPQYLIDYVILHELCHTIEKNHGVNFWALLDKCVVKAKEIDKQLRNYSIKLY